MTSTEKKLVCGVGVEYKVYNDSLGFQYKEIGELNADMPAYVSVGLFLEWVEENVKTKNQTTLDIIKKY